MIKIAHGKFHSCVSHQVFFNILQMFAINFSFKKNVFALFYALGKIMRSLKFQNEKKNSPVLNDKIDFSYFLIVWILI